MIKALKKKLWIGTAILVLLLVISIFGVIRFEIDLALVIWGIAGFLIAYSIYVLVSYFTAPRRQVTISTRVELSSPPKILKSVRNYRLKVTSEKHIEEKGKERSVKMDELIMSFNSSDHPDAYDYCLRVISAHMEACVNSAKEAHPEANVIGSPLSLPPELKQLED